MRIEEKILGAIAGIAGIDLYMCGYLAGLNRARGIIDREIRKAGAQ